MHHLDLLGGVEIGSARKERTEGKKRECRTSAGALPENMHRTEGSQALQVSAFRCTGLGQSFEMAPFRCSVRLLSNSAFEAKTKLRLLRSEKAGCLQDLHAQRESNTSRHASVGEPSRSGVSGGRRRPDSDRTSTLLLRPGNSL